MSAVHALLRREVLDARRQNWIGQISLRQPLAWWVVTAVAVALALAVFGFLVFGSYTRHAAIEGRLTLDGTQLQAELQVPSRLIGHVAAGDRVRLRYAAFPHRIFGQHEGSVIAISRITATDPADTQTHEPHYQVRVALARQDIEVSGRSEPLQAGMRLQADLRGERRRLIEWMLEP